MSKREELASIVARKVFGADGHELTTDEAVSVVDAILDALMEPTEGMKDAAMDILLFSGDIYENSDGQIVIETITPRDLLRAMIQAARDGK